MIFLKPQDRDLDGLSGILRAATKHLQGFQTCTSYDKIYVSLFQKITFCILRFNYLMKQSNIINWKLYYALEVPKYQFVKAKTKTVK